MKLKTIRIESKSYEEALKEASKVLNIEPNKIDLKLIDEKKGILGLRSKQIYEATYNISIVTEGKNYLEQIFSKMEISSKMEIKTNEKEQSIIYNVETSENGILIGVQGQTLQAIQLLLRQYLNRFTDEHLIINLDIGGYQAYRKTQLEILATKTAKEVVKTKVEAELHDLNSYERRVIHTKLLEWRDVETYSINQGDERVLIIKPKN